MPPSVQKNSPSENEKSDAWCDGHSTIIMNMVPVLSSVGSGDHCPLAWGIQ